MRWSTRLLVVGGFLVWLGVFIAAVAAVAAYYHPESRLQYTDPINVDILSRSLRSPDAEAFRKAFTRREWLLSGIAGISLLVVAFTWKSQKSAVRCIVFSSHFVLLPWGWMGALMIPYAMVGPLDGEWLAEHSPTFIAAGIWFLYAALMIFVSCDSRWFFRAAPRSGADPNPKS